MLQVAVNDAQRHDYQGLVTVPDDLESAERT